MDSFKHIEEKYRRNVDEWLCNLYIEVRRRDLYDFAEYKSKILLTTKKIKEKQSFTDRAKKLMFGKVHDDNP